MILFHILTGLSLAVGAGAGAASVRVEGFGFEVGELANGVKAFANRTYVWDHVPKDLEGWEFTRLAGGVRGRLTATPDANARLYIAHRPGGVDLKGWRVVPKWRFCYTDANRTMLRIFARQCKAGVPVHIPQGGWTGCILIARSIDGQASMPEPDHSRAPGVVIDHRPKCTQNFVGCPGIAILPNGDYIATHSFFGRGVERGQTLVFRSRDKGRTWKNIAEGLRQSFSTPFVHRGALYLMGVGGKGPCIVIRQSDDRGESWTEPKDDKTGVLRSDASYHSAPVPVIVHKGRVWRAMEDRGAGRGWPRQFRAFMLSAPVEADLLAASSWTRSNPLSSDRSWLNREFRGWLEGNAVVTPAGEVVNILRVDTWLGGKAALIRVSPDGRTCTFDPATGMLDFPGGAKKFTVRFDPASKLYWALTNPVNEDERAGRSAGSVRNTLALISSPDLQQWTMRRIACHHPDPVFHGFQYVDWHFDGDDIVAVSRTSYDDGISGAHNFHDANYFTFHRVADFRRE